MLLLVMCDERIVSFCVLFDLIDSAIPFSRFFFLLSFSQNDFKSMLIMALKPRMAARKTQFERAYDSHERVSLIAETIFAIAVVFDWYDTCAIY